MYNGEVHPNIEPSVNTLKSLPCDGFVTGM